LQPYRSFGRGSRRDAEKTIATTHRVAVCSMLEAAEYMAEYEPDFPIHSVRMIGIIVIAIEPGLQFRIIVQG
jgi:hypothetical protein